MDDEYCRERISFSVDMIRYFLRKYNVELDFIIFSRYFDGYPRKFTQSMGSIARHLALTKMDAVKDWDEDNPFCLERNFLFSQKFSKGYNPEDFLHYCGLMGLSMIWNYRNREYDYAFKLFISIKYCLYKAIEDGLFFAYGGWKALEKYADETLCEINAKSLAERILFAEDMIKYFMERSQVEWTPGTNGNLDGNRRRFTKEIGSAAWWLENCPIISSQITMHENRLVISTAYHPRDLLQFCGITAMNSVWHFVNGNYEYPDAAVHEIVAYLGEIHQNEYFHLSGGWDDIAHFACILQLGIIRGMSPYQMQWRQADITQEIQEAEEDETLMEQHCIGTLLQDL